MTTFEQILLATQGLGTEFSLETLIIACWQKFPDAFGLDGHKDCYPDANRVIVCLSGKRGVVGKGWLLRIRPKVYALTDAGRSMLARLLDPGLAAAAADHEQLLARLLGSAALRKLDGGHRDKLTFGDAKEFWGNGGSAEATVQKLREVERMLDSGPIRLPGGVQVTAATIRLLLNANNFLASKFEKRLQWSA